MERLDQEMRERCEKLKQPGDIARAIGRAGFVHHSLASPYYLILAEGLDQGSPDHELIEQCHFYVSTNFIDEDHPETIAAHCAKFPYGRQLIQDLAKEQVQSTDDSCRVKAQALWRLIIQDDPDCFAENTVEEFLAENTMDSNRSAMHLCRELLKEEKGEAQDIQNIFLS